MKKNTNVLIDSPYRRCCYA